jgi:hypothetical protein
MNATQDARFVSQMLGGNKDALRLMSDFLLVMKLWDDLVNGGEVTVTQVNQALWAAMSELPANIFYRQHFDLLHPILITTMIKWMGAGSIQRDPTSGDDALALAYGDSLVASSLLLALTLAASGPTVAAQYAGAIRQFDLGGGLARYAEEVRALRGEVTSG